MGASTTESLIKTPLGLLIEKAELWRRAKLKHDWEGAGLKYHVLRTYTLHRSISKMNDIQRSVILSNFPEAAPLFERPKPQPVKS